MFLFVLDRVYISVEGVFVLSYSFDRGRSSKESFLFQEAAIWCIQNVGGALRALLKLNPSRIHYDTGWKEDAV